MPSRRRARAPSPDTQVPTGACGSRRERYATSYECKVDGIRIRTMRSRHSFGHIRTQCIENVGDSVRFVCNAFRGIYQLRVLSADVHRTHERRAP